MSPINIRNILSFCIASLLCIACSQSGNDTENNSVLRTDTIPYVQTTIYEYSPYFQQKDDVLDTTFFRVSFPHAQDESFNDLIFKALNVDNREDLEHIAAAFLESYDNYVEEASNPEMIHPWFHEVKSNVTLYTPNLFVMSTQTSEYTGGAHGNYFELLYNFDVNKSQLIALKDILDVDKTKEFLNIAEKHFREQEGLDAQASLEENYFFDDGVFVLADNFAFAEDAFVFRYNPYEIKPWSGGVTTLHIPYSEAEHLLNETGKAYIHEIKNDKN